MTVPKMAKKTGGMAPKRKMKGGAKDENGNEIPDENANEVPGEKTDDAKGEAPAEAAAEAPAGETTNEITVGDKTYTVTVNGAKVCVEPAAAAEASFGGKKGKKRTQKKKGKKPRKSAKKAKK